MAKQSEQILEEQFIAQLQKLGYDYISIADEIKDNSNVDFYEHYFESGKINKQIHKIAQKGARNHYLLNLSVVEFFKDIDILKPHIKEQEKTASSLNEISKQIALVNEQLEETRTFKKALLSKMFC